MEKEGKISDLLKLELNSVEYLHALIEALRLSFADTRYVLLISATEAKTTFGVTSAGES